MKGDNQKPDVWVGHIKLVTDRIEASTDFMQKIGMRLILNGDGFAIFELRGGTHLILAEETPFTPGDASFDLMVEDLEATHQQLADLGLNPSPIEPGTIHSSFTITEPAGNRILFNSTHVSNLPV